MNKFEIPTNIESEAKSYIENVVNMLEENGLMEDVDTAALTMLARNYNVFIKASKQIEREGITVTSDRGNVSAHPAVKIANDAQVQAMKVMEKFGLTAKDRTKIAKLNDSCKELSPLEQFVKDSKETR